MEDIKALVTEDWDEIKNDQSKLNTWAQILYEQREMRAGRVPPRFTAETFCLSCNKHMPISPALANGGKVLGCPWCAVRAQ